MNRLDTLLQKAAEEKIDFKTIDYKTQKMIHCTPKVYITPRAGLATALSLFAFVSILASFNVIDNYSEPEYSAQTSSDIMYDTIVSAYDMYLED